MRIRENPYIGEMIERGERRLIVIRFPHKVIYRILPERVVVVAVAHQRRRALAPEKARVVAVC